MTQGTVPRDRFDRPLIAPPDGGGALVPYQRVTKYIDVLEDTFNITEWQKRLVAVGMAGRSDLCLRAASLSAEKPDPDEERERKAELKKIANEAKEWAGGSKSASIGSTLHEVTERYDLGLSISTLPDPYQGDVEAFQSATELLEPVAVEQFLVNDYIGAAGTADRLYRVADRPVVTIGDTKTGSSLKYGMGKIAMQLAVYSRSVLYDPETQRRETVDIDQDWGLIVHLPAGQNKCELLWVDLQMGWAGVLLAREVREFRKLGRKQLTRAVNTEELIR